MFAPLGKVAGGQEGMQGQLVFAEEGGADWDQAVAGVVQGVGWCWRVGLVYGVGWCRGYGGAWDGLVQGVGWCREWGGAWRAYST